jgi:hypothetical protein
MRTDRHREITLITFHTLRTIFYFSLALVSSCSKNTSDTSLTTSPIKQTPTTTEKQTAPTNWSQAISVDSCGPTDGIMHQIRFGWILEKENKALSQVYPSMLIAYENDIQIYSADYCSAATQCESIAQENIKLSLKEPKSDGSFEGAYEITLPSGKSISGQFNVAKEARISLDAICG